MKYLFILTLACYSFGAIAQGSSQEEKLDAAFQIIATQYVDELDEEKMVEDAITGMLKKLDPHSVYIPAKRVDEENQKLASEFEGIGVQFNILDDTIIVISPIAGGPSEKLGIMAGDKIVRINEENVAGVGIDNDGVRDRLLGNKGTTVDVSIKRAGVRELLDFTITRDKIPLYSVDASYMVSPATGYIKVNRFAAETAQEFRDALTELKQQGMSNLILDLTGNGGGYLYAAFELADEFLSWGHMIVYTEGVNSPKRELRASSRGSFEEGKLIVLIDEGSASASEIVTGAVQDWDRGLVIGRRSFGKGLVQKPYKLPDNSEIRLTIARYYTPTGRCIQKSYENGREEYYAEINERFERGELTAADSIHVPDSLRYYTPNDRLLYGGGGIMPDIFIPIDTTPNTDFLRNVMRKGYTNQFAIQYVDKHRRTLEAYTSVIQFSNQFDMKEVMEEFTDFLTTKELTATTEEWERSGNLLEYQLKAMIARNMYNVSAFYQIYNITRSDYRKAIEVMENEEAFKQMRVQTH